MCVVACLLCNKGLPGHSFLKVGFSSTLSFFISCCKPLDLSHSTYILYCTMPVWCQPYWVRLQSIDICWPDYDSVWPVTVYISSSHKVIISLFPLRVILGCPLTPCCGIQTPFIAPLEARARLSSIRMRDIILSYVVSAELRADWNIQRQ